METTLLPTLQINHISLVYPGSSLHARPALEDITLEVQPGEICGLLGKPASGKTSLLRAAAGRVEPASGKVLYSGSSPMCTWLQDDPHPDVPAGATLVMPASSGDPAGELADVLGLCEFAGNPFSALPQTYRDRARLLPLLLDPAPLILLDEHPGLSAETAARLGDWLPDWIHSREQALILATQHVGIIQMLCDRVVVLHQGRLAGEMPVRQASGQLLRSCYVIRLAGRLDPAGIRVMDGLSIRLDNGDTVIRGEFPDQPALYGLLARLRDLGLALISLEQVDQDQAARLAELMENGAG